MSIRNLAVEPVLFRNEVVGYSISGIYRDCSDSMWEDITHNAIFRTKERAEKFFQKFLAAKEDMNMQHWNVGYSWNRVYSVI